VPDLVSCLLQGFHDHFRLPHCKQRVQAAPAGLTVLYESSYDYGSNRGFSSIYCHDFLAVPAATFAAGGRGIFTKRLPAPGSWPGCSGSSP
jgi:hypothetical protein